MSILVLGLGNILLMDEGVGVRAMEAFDAQWAVPEHVSVIDGGTCGMDMLDIIASHDHLIAIDAVKTGADPATLVVLRGDEVPAYFKGKLSPHQLGLSDLLASLKLQEEGPQTVTVIGCVPLALGTGLMLSPEIEAKVPEMVDLIVTELRRHGVEPIQKA
ncbi:HyaD/HybD family hydrogenase maturation endopeptidase [Azospirillum soli]|uniref:HyaD/HybD family hydrogenase maturation endopeptidase n=1 Tax=Azospirillum soli TaxID=1304799 RepID=UPI001AE57B7B|nr:HyaD/HybD family hydrogenase maturation endopeptidase [Azospirillum soli]MBP2315967.1 hydrogenase maturation protease [Azospirillum soli]